RMSGRAVPDLHSVPLDSGQTVAVRAEREARSAPFEREELFAVGDIPELDRAVSAACGEPAAVAAPGDADDGIGVTPEDVLLLGRVVEDVNLGPVAARFGAVVGTPRRLGTHAHRRH